MNAEAPARGGGQEGITSMVIIVKFNQIRSDLNNYPIQLLSG